MDLAARWLKIISMALALIAPAAQAQDGRGDVVYVPTPQIVVDEMLKMAKVGASDYLIDLGSGDGRIVITAAKRLGARGTGVDLDTYLLKIANATAKKEGVADRARFIEQNLFETDLSAATVISSYLLPEMNAQIEWAPGRFYKPDCLWREAMLIVELDGGQAHMTKKSFHADPLRDRRLRVLGYETWRVTYRHLDDELENQLHARLGR